MVTFRLAGKVLLYISYIRKIIEDARNIFFMKKLAMSMYFKSSIETSRR